MGRGRGPPASRRGFDRDRRPDPRGSSPIRRQTDRLAGASRVPGAPVVADDVLNRLDEVLEAVLFWSSLTARDPLPPHGRVLPRRRGTPSPGTAGYSPDCAGERCLTET